MNWFNNLKIRMKLLLGFLLISVLSLILGLISLKYINQIDNDSDFVIKDIMQPNEIISKSLGAFQRMRNNLLEYIVTSDPAKQNALLEKFHAREKEIIDFDKEFESRIKIDSIKTAFEKYKKIQKNYFDEAENFITLFSSYELGPKLAMYNGNLDPIRLKYQEAINEIYNIGIREAGIFSEAQDNNAGSAKLYSILITIFIFFAGSAVGLFLAGKISKPINYINNIAKEINKGNLNAAISVQSNDEIGDLAGSFSEMVKTIKSLDSEITFLISSAIDGKLSIRGNIDKFTGGYKDLVNGINCLLDAVIKPLNVAAEYVDRISKGDIPIKITDTYSGDFNEIKNNLNGCIDAVNLLVEDANLLSKAAVEGKLANRADISKHNGSFQKIIVGVNDTLDAVIGPLNMAAEYVDRISKGDIPIKITDTYNGDFNEIKININTLIDAMSSATEIASEISKGNLDNKIALRSADDKLMIALRTMTKSLQNVVKDVFMLSEAAIAGNMEKRADEVKHEGDFRKIISGINGTLDTVVDKVFWYESLLDSVAMPISVTDLDMKWTFINKPVENLLKIKRKDVLGDHCSKWNAAICNTEKCGVAGLRKNQLQTVFAQQGMNFQVDTSYILDRKGNKIGHIEVVQDVTARVKIAEYSNIEVERLAGNMKNLALGDSNLDLNVSEGNEYTKLERENFSKINENFKEVNEIVQTIFAGVNRVSTGINDGKLGDRGNTELYSGDWKKLVAGINSIIDALSNPINFMAENINKISKGEIPTRIRDEYKGEFNSIKNNLNTCFESINSLVSDAVMLSTAAVEGKLSTRADVSKHFGDFRKIVEGVNKTLDSVIIPVNEGVAALEKMSSGDMTVRITSDYKGDHQLIKNSINAVCESLSMALGEVSEAIAATASASNQISSSTEEMAAGTGEQTHQTTEVASGVEEMTRTILENTKNVSLAADTAKDAGERAKEGGKVVNETIEGMNKIAEVVKKSAETVQALGKSSDQIGEIVQVIDDIADQTNLLALNAAIEAARAGEQGRGFAVVADEVRKLAERTTKATKEIATMIRQIQKDTSNAVNSMNEGTNEVERGKVLANRAGDSLHEIVEGSQKVVDIVSQVAAASEEQSTAAEQISRNIEAISSVAQESAAGTQQIARAAEDLSRLTVNLENLINQFKLSNSHSSKQIAHNDNHRKHLGY